VERQARGKPNTPFEDIYILVKDPQLLIVSIALKLYTLTIISETKGFMRFIQNSSQSGSDVKQSKL